MIAQALDSGKRTKWTIIMIGGGSFAAAVFHGIHSAIKTSYKRIKHVIVLHNAHIEIYKIYYKIYSMQLCVS